MQFACGIIGYFKFIDDKEGATEVPPLFLFRMLWKFSTTKIIDNHHMLQLLIIKL